MATGFSATPRKEGTWTKLVIFVSLLFLILESILQLVLVLFLYGRHQVDSKMTVSLILALVSSFMTIPLVSLQSLVAWQYNKIGGFGQQKTVLHNICSYTYRLDLMLWLATSVSGLVVAAQQVYCLPEGTDATFWRVGVSCAFHRSTVIVSVVALVTVCTMYCARELCDRPYDVSIIGIYSRSQQIVRRGSILSGHSWGSDETLKNEILNLCRQHDGKAGEEPWYLDPIANKVSCHPSIRHPAPVRQRPQLRVNTNPGSEYGEITTGTSVSPDDTFSHTSPGGQTAVSDFYPISRTSTVLTTHTTSESKNLLAEFFAPKVPPIPKQYTAYHKRGKSSLSSLKRFLPKSFPLSLPLSSDPQIRALADPNAASDVEKQVVTPSTAQDQSQSKFLEINTLKTATVTSSTSTATEPAKKSTEDSNSKKPEGHNRTMTMNSADAPEVVVAPEPANVRRSQTEHLATAGRSIHHPHHPNYVPRPAPSPGPLPVTKNRRYSTSCRQNATIPPLPIMPASRSSPRTMQSPVVQLPAPVPAPVRSSSYSFEQSRVPRHSQTQYHPQYYPPQPIPTRWASQHVFDPSRVVPAPRRNDVEIIYPSTRRPRSSTHGGASGPLSCILEATSDPRASMDEAHLSSTQSQRNVLDHNTYRGANRTSMGFY